MTAPDGPVLVVGTYPPIPRPAAAASVEMVRRAWSEGREVKTVSPRLSAADLAVSVSGPLAGVRLDRLRRMTGAHRLALVIEPDFPVPAGPAVMQLTTAVGLRWALARFDVVTLVRVGDAALSPSVLATISGAATEVLDRPGGPLPEGVTPYGPPETEPRELPAELAAKVVRRVLGRHAGPARAWAGRVRRRARALGR